MTIWRIACWMRKATNTHSEYVILTAFSLQQWLHKRASVFRYTHAACFVLFILRPCPNLVPVKKQGLLSCGKPGQIESPYTAEVSNTWNFIPLHYLRLRRKEGRKKGGKKKGRSQYVWVLKLPRRLPLFCTAVSGRAVRITGSEVMLTQDASLHEQMTSGPKRVFL